MGSNYGECPDALKGGSGRGCSRIAIGCNGGADFQRRKGGFRMNIG